MDQSGTSIAVSTASTTVLSMVCVVACIWGGRWLWRAYRDRADANARTELSDAIASEIRGMTTAEATAHLRRTRPWMEVNNPYEMSDKMGRPPREWTVRLIPKIAYVTPVPQGWHAKPSDGGGVRGPARVSIQSPPVSGFVLSHWSTQMPVRYLQ